MDKTVFKRKQPVANTAKRGTSVIEKSTDTEIRGNLYAKCLGEFPIRKAIAPTNPMPKISNRLIRSLNAAPNVSETLSPNDKQLDSAKTIARDLVIFSLLESRLLSLRDNVSLRLGDAMKIDFLLPIRSDIAIVDNSSSQIIIDFLDSLDSQATHTVIHTRLELLNLWVFIGGLFTLPFYRVRGFSLWLWYVETYLKFVRPKLVLTFIDNNPEFWKLSKRAAGQYRTAFFQNGRRYNLLDVFETVNARDDYFVDAMFVHSNASASLYEKVVGGNIHVVGSIKNNSLVPPSSLSRKRQVVWMSGWEPYSDSANYAHDLFGEPVGYERYFEVDEKLLSMVAQYCKKRGFVLQIAGRESKSDGDEHEYFKSVLGDIFFEFSPKLGLLSNYELLDASLIGVSLDGTLAYESLARGNRTAIFPWRSETLRSPASLFAWPLTFPSQGPFWDCKQEFSAVERVLDTLTLASDKEWKNTVEKYAPLVMATDWSNALTKLVTGNLLEDE